MIDFTQLGLNSLQKQINPRDIFMGLSNKSKKYQYPRMFKEKFGNNGLNKEMIEIP